MEHELNCEDQNPSEVTEAVEGTHEMFVSDEADRNKGQRVTELASECHNTANDDVELDCLSQLNRNEPAPEEQNTAILKLGAQEARLRSTQRRY
ncbi:uncharacterized protein LOC141897012 isoform X2 [Acropora palmata]|uniref:uncharacterized protein LOC141897012 isoform X2 n=1 Tax=Acropora palmata TaxID=6131 RepID=UPI003DA0A5A1